MLPQLITLGLFGFLLHSTSLSAQESGLDASCGNLSENTFHRPIDYFASTPEFRGRIEGPHFPPHVENLQRGNTDTTPGHDISYTLRTFPNHHRALMAMINLGRKEKTNKPRGSDFTIDCWLNRALYFKPDDGIIRLIYSIELMRRAKYSQAVTQLLKSDELLINNGNVQYNLGLAYFELHEYDKALVCAHKAYALGFTLEGLPKKLKASGHWREPQSASQQMSGDSANSIESKNEEKKD